MRHAQRPQRKIVDVLLDMLDEQRIFETVTRFRVHHHFERFARVLQLVGELNRVLQ